MRATERRRASDGHRRARVGPQSEGMPEGFDHGSQDGQLPLSFILPTGISCDFFFASTRARSKSPATQALRPDASCASLPFLYPHSIIADTLNVLDSFELSPRCAYPSMPVCPHVADPSRARSRTFLQPAASLSSPPPFNRPLSLSLLSSLSVLLPRPRQLLLRGRPQGRSLTLASRLFTFGRTSWRRPSEQKSPSGKA